MLYNQLHYLFPKNFLITLNRNSLSNNYPFFSPSRPWLISFSILSSRFIHVTASIRTNSPFYGWIIFHSVYLQYFVYPFICWYIIRLFLPFGYCNAETNTGLKTSLWLPTFNFFGYMTMSKIVGYTVIPCLTFWVTTKLFPIAAASFHTLTSNAKAPVSLHPQQHLLFVCLLNYIQASSIKWYLTL